MHNLLVTDVPPAIDNANPDYYTVKEVLDALLCKMKARHIPYDPNQSPAINSRWRDIKEQPGSGDLAEPNTVQEAIDELIQSLDADDIFYEVQECGTSAAPTVRTRLGIGHGQQRIGDIFEALLCNFRASELPVDRNDLCARLQAQPQVLTVQDAINALCSLESGGGCAVTVGIGGSYPTIEEAVNSDEFKNASEINICLLPGNHDVGKPNEKLDVLNKTTISISGYEADVFLHGSLILEALNITLRAIRIFVYDKDAKSSRGSGNIKLVSKSGKVVIENCNFYRDYEGADWAPLIEVGSQTTLRCNGNFMTAIRQFEEVVSATLPRESVLSAEGLDALGGLKSVLAMNPYEDVDAYDAQVKVAAEKIAGLDKNTRGDWHDGRFCQPDRQIVKYAGAHYKAQDWRCHFPTLTGKRLSNRCPDRYWGGDACSAGKRSVAKVAAAGFLRAVGNRW